jgi:hypothetical protein
MGFGVFIFGASCLCVYDLLEAGTEVENILVRAKQSRHKLQIYKNNGMGSKHE